MKKQHFIFLFVLLTAFSACRSRNNRTIKKTEKGFSLGDTERRMTNSVYIDIPECFEIDNYNNISINDKNNFQCYKSYTYFSLDEFSLGDIESYMSYNSVKNKKKMTKLEYILEYAIEQRINSLFTSERSKISESKTDRGDKMLYASVIGKESSYGEEINYTFSSVQVNGKYYIMQAIAKADAMPFYFNDFRSVFKSIRRV